MKLLRAAGLAALLSVSSSILAADLKVSRSQRVFKNSPDSVIYFDKPVEYTVFVNRGDNLSSIANQLYRERYERGDRFLTPYLVLRGIINYNKIQEPDLIFPGERYVYPIEEEFF